MKSTQAECAKAIRQLLKTKFPFVKFSIRSRSFAGGDSVDVSWTDGPTTRTIDSLIGKFQYGHFNGMTDCYEYSNRESGIPQSKYVQTSRHMAPETGHEIKMKIAESHGIEDPSDEKEWQEKFNHWSDSVVYREFSETAYMR